jgi:hypothetical protein
MAYPVDTTVETAISTIESVLVENLQFENSRDDISAWRFLLRRVEARVDDGATGYDALTQRDWSADKLTGV